MEDRPGPGAPPPEISSRPGRAGLVVLTLAVVLVFLGALLGSTEGHFVPQGPDLYLVCQYARAMAEGHPFRYNPGEPPSTGATSLLHTAWLGAAQAAGVRGEGLVAFAILTAAALFLPSVLLARRLGERLRGPREGLLAGVLLAVGGPVAWAFHSGGDIAVFMLLSLWLFDRLLAGAGAPPPGAPGPRPALTPLGGGILAATLLALARPEGLPLGLALGVFWVLGAARVAPPSRRLLAALPAATGFAVLLLNRALTGSWVGSSLADKSMLANYGLAETLSLVSGYAVDVVRGLLLGFYPSQTPIGFSRGWAAYYFPPLGLLLVLLALVRTEGPLRRPLLFWAGCLAALFALVSPNVFAGVHFNRYLLWGIPSLLVLVAVGLGDLTRLLARDDPRLERALFRAGAALLVGLGALSTLRFATLYGGLAGDMWRRDVAAAHWISGNLPPGVRMANLATSVEYLTGHHNVNLHGVTSPAFFGNLTAERDLGVWEALARLPPAERPQYLIGTDSLQEGSPLVRELVAGPALFRTTGPGDEIQIHRLRYDRVDQGQEPLLPEARAAVAGRTLVDRLNVGDSRDEADHGYEHRSELGGLRLHGTLRFETLPGSDETLGDGGRAILGHEAFTLRSRPGRDLLLVLRTAPTQNATVLRADGQGSLGMSFAAAGFILEVDGNVVARLAFRPRPGWDEQVVQVPGSVIRSDRTRFRLRGRYASFRYWAYQ